ncbi:MAG: RNA 2',3'-cyclic phosphodiesterase [Rhodocyclaceae bacterium]|nr:RNA 2',3'-cyclic phosphodiesterase [Rhodocyclaceae bacterium]
MTEETAAPQRVFFALWPDAAALDALEAAATAGIARCGGRRMGRDSLHLTLAFIGAVSPAQLDKLLNLAGQLKVAPFDLLLDQLGWWPHNRILWAGCQAAPPCQRRLFDELSFALAAAGFPVDQRPYSPHVTLVRNARCAGCESLPVLAAPVRWRVDTLTLAESCLQPSGARYRVLAHWPLRG